MENSTRLLAPTVCHARLAFTKMSAARRTANSALSTSTNLQLVQLLVILANLGATKMKKVVPGARFVKLGLFKQAVMLKAARHARPVPRTRIILKMHVLPRRILIQLTYL